MDLINSRCDIYIWINRFHLIDLADDSTGVFWDLDDCSTPNDSRPHLIYQNIKSALENKGYRGEVSISAYVQNETLPDDLLDILREAGVKISFVPKGEFIY